MRVRLEVVEGPEQGRKVSFSSGQIVKIGRTDWSDLTFASDPHLSGQHFALSVEDGICRLIDLESRNGTFVHDQRVTDTQINDGDVIAAGHTKFRVQLIGSTGSFNVPDFALQDALRPSDEQTPSTPKPSPPPQVKPSSPPSSVEVAEDSPIIMESLDEESRKTVPDTDHSLSSKFDLLSADLPEPFRSGLADDDPGVRGAAIEAAVWRREKWVLDYCRRLTKSPRGKELAALRILAVLGEPSDLRRFRRVGQATKLGPERYSLLGVYGHPGVVHDLLVAAQSDDEEASLTAKAAFTRVTGLTILAADAELEPDETELTLKQAWDWWERQESRFHSGCRWSWGIDVSSRQVKPEWTDILPMSSLIDATLRAHYFGATRTRWANLLSFPFQQTLSAIE